MSACSLRSVFLYQLLTCELSPKTDLEHGTNMSSIDLKQWLESMFKHVHITVNDIPGRSILRQGGLMWAYSLQGLQFMIT